VAGWTLDEKRFREEVFRAQEKGWDPRTNLFRCYQLPLQVSDLSTIEAALKGVRGFVNRNAISGTQSGAAKVLLGVHKDAVATLSDETKRGKHRALVTADRNALQQSLRAELAGAHAIPPAAAAAMAARREPRFVRAEVLEALAAVGCRVQEPVELPVRIKPPSTWKEVQLDLAFLEFPTLRTYLQQRFTVDVGVRDKQLEDHRTKLQRTASGDALTAEMKILGAVQKWLAAGQLVELLRADLLRELVAEAAMGGDGLTAALRAPGMPRYLTDLGLPAAADLAYALLCEVRFPTAPPMSWQSTYREARTNRDLRTAYDVLVGQQLDRELAKERDALKAEIAEIDAMLAQARRLEDTDAETAAEIYVRAAQRCRDPEADSAVRRCRPREPGQVVATVNGDSVHVEWTPSNARVGDISYRVVRRVDGGGPGDGGIVQTGVSGLSVTDGAAPAGVPVSYAVWTLRNDQPSAAASASASVAVLRAVQNLELVSGEKWVEVRWELPEGAAGVRVVRRADGSPDTETSRHDGGSFRDTGVRTGVIYEYRVESEYRLRDGSQGHGAPVIGRIRPQEPPQPVRDLTLAVTEDSILLSWSPPPRGEVRVRGLDTAPDVRPGQLVAVAVAERLGVRLRPTEPPQDGRLRMALPTDGRRHWLLPLTVIDGLAVVGNPVEYDSRLPAITDLRAERLGGQIRLTWCWPPRVSEVLVIGRAGVPPTGPDDPSATPKRLTHASYQRAGCHLVTSGGDHWVGVCVTAFTDGAPVHGPMVTAGVSAPGEAGYEIRRVGGFRNRHRRRLLVSAPTGALPGVRVIARTRIPPLHPDDGVEVARFPAPGTGETSLSGEFALTVPGRPLFLRAFPLDGAGGDVVLVPTNPTQLRID